MAFKARLEDKIEETLGSWKCFIGKCSWILEFSSKRTFTHFTDGWDNPFQYYWKENTSALPLASLLMKLLKPSMGCSTSVQDWRSSHAESDHWSIQLPGIWLQALRLLNFRLLTTNVASYSYKNTFYFFIVNSKLSEERTELGGTS